MHKEIEATFAEINKDDIRTQLKALGGELIQPERLMRRVIFDLGEHSFVRVRDEGDTITMTYKIVQDLSLTGTNEVNLTVDDYEAAIEFVKGCGLRPKSNQETRREKWRLGEVEVDIDTWPWLPTTIDIEGPSAKSVQTVVQQLGLDMADAYFGSINEVYKHYYDVTDHEINYCPEIKFTDIPEWLAAKRR